MNHKYLADFKIPNTDFTIPDPAGFIFVGNKENLGAVIGDLLNYLFPLAGVILFGILVWGGFEMMTSMGNEEGLKKAKSRITSAIIGIVIIFTSYWLIQIVQAIFHLGKTVTP